MNNPAFDDIRQSLRNLPPEKAEQIKSLLAKRLLLAQYGPKPPMGIQLTANKLNKEKL